jgi:hypothetical protein
MSLFGDSYTKVENCDECGGSGMTDDYELVSGMKHYFKIVCVKCGGGERICGLWGSKVKMGSGKIKVTYRKSDKSIIKTEPYGSSKGTYKD